MYQQPQSVPPYPVDRGDELSLIELWKVLVNYKLLIVVFTVLTTLGAIYYASTLPTIYKTGVLMFPAGGGNSVSSKLGGLSKINIGGFSLGGGSDAGIEGEQALARLKTRSFLINHIKEKNLKHILFANRWSNETKLWIDQQPSDRESSERLLGMITTVTASANKAGLVIQLITIN